jgi:N-acetylglutamate synthase-like GNAT family acetyltransferase
VSIRQARGADAEALAALYQALVIDPHVNVRPERLEVLAADPNTYLLVCEIDGVVCGTALLTLCLDAMYGNQPYGVIENVVVAETQRSHGIGRELMAHVEDLCRKHDCSKMMLLSATSRAHAHRFFERHGFSAANKRGFVKYRSQFQPLQVHRGQVSDR